MKNKFFCIPFLTLALLTCEPRNSAPPSKPSTRQDTSDHSNVSLSNKSSKDKDTHNRRNPHSNSHPDPANTDRNRRDRDPGSLTAFDQSENEKDRVLSQKLRRALVKDPFLSTNAKNIKIITINRVVTLRGPVNTSQEKAAIERIIAQIEGIERVDNQLEVPQ